MSLKLGDTFPDFHADTSAGPMHFYDWLGQDGSWAMIFSHPADFTPVCTTELARVLNLLKEFSKRKVKVAAVACDGAEIHKAWEQDIRAYAKRTGDAPETLFPIIADPKRELAVKLGMLDPDEKDEKGLPLTCRAVFLVAPDRRVRLSILYPATTGRNFDEILRAVDSVLLTNKHREVATPVDWKPGEKCMIMPTVKKEDYQKLFPKGYEVVELPSGKDYVKMTDQPVD